MQQLSLQKHLKTSQHHRTMVETKMDHFKTENSVFFKKGENVESQNIVSTKYCSILDAQVSAVLLRPDHRSHAITVLINQCMFRYT